MMVARTSATPAAVHGSRRPLPVDRVRLLPDRGLGAWQRLNADATIGHCIANLESSGVLDNFRRLIGESDAEFRGFWFADSDLYKTVEAVAWEIGRSGTHAFDPWLDEVIALVARAQDADGYVMTYVQGSDTVAKFEHLDYAHELYVLGHLIQAAVALDRCAGRNDLLGIALRFADLVHDTFGPQAKRQGYCGHPEIETALVELARHTGDERYLGLASHMVELRGSGLLRVGGLGARYFQDHAPVRESLSAVGHAVRQLYLNAGVTDIHLEHSDESLMDAMRAQWDSAHQRKMYISGAFGSRHRDEAFGDDYELPSERAYAETCATIADLHWSWRMYLAEGGSRYGDVVEREIHNALAASIDTTGTRFFYSNPLQQRPDRYSEENAPRQRTPWYACACCPPNIARTVAQLATYVASLDGDELVIHQYADADITLDDGSLVQLRTDYPVSGEITLRGQAASVALRVPAWCARARLNGRDATPDADGYVRAPLRGELTLDLDLTPRWTEGHHRADAIRGCLALERGPVVYCIEQVDVADAEIDDLFVDADIAPQPAGGGRLSLSVRARLDDPPLYGAPTSRHLSDPFQVVAVPFSTWGNRAPGAMRVWLPTV